MTGSASRARRRFIVLVSALVVFSACRLDIDVATQVEEDGSGEVAVTFLLGETVRGTLREKEMKTDDPAELLELRKADEDIWEYGPDPVDSLEEEIPPGWEGERVTQGKSEGMILRGAFSSLDELPELLDSLSGFGAELAERVDRKVEDVGVAALVRGFSITRDGDQFHFEAAPDVTAYEGAEGGSNRLAAVFTLSVDLPGGIREDDADEEQDGALVWQIAPGTERTISATSDLTYSPTEIPWMPIGVGGSAAAIAGLLALRSVRDRRRGAGAGDEPPGPSGMPERTPEPV